jgi:hypothetical protein
MQRAIRFGMGLGNFTVGAATFALGVIGAVMGAAGQLPSLGSSTAVIALSITVATAGAIDAEYGLQLMMAASRGGDRGGDDDDEGRRYSRSGREGRGTGANRADARQIADAARRAGIEDRRGFGDFVENVKAGQGRGGADNFTFQELLDLAEEFKAQGGR